MATCIQPINTVVYINMDVSTHPVLPLMNGGMWDRLSVYVCVCVCLPVCVSGSVARSDKRRAGSTSLQEEGKPQQWGTGGREAGETAVGGG